MPSIGGTQQIAVHPDLAELCYRGLQDFESLEGTDLVRFSALMDEMFRTCRMRIISTWRGIWIHACGVASKRACAKSMQSWGSSLVAFTLALVR